MLLLWYDIFVNWLVFIFDDPKRLKTVSGQRNRSAGQQEVCHSVSNASAAPTDSDGAHSSYGGGVGKEKAGTKFFI